MSEMALELIRKAKTEGWKKLDLGNCGIHGPVPEEVGELEDLEELYLSRDWYRWGNAGWEYGSSSNLGAANILTSLPSKLPLKLKVLVAFENKISNLLPLNMLLHLQTLVINDSLITDLSPLKELIRLEALVLNGTPVSDIQPIARLAQLRALLLAATRVTNLTPLAGLSQLEVLNLSDTKVQDITPLEGLQRFKDLHLSNTIVSDITPLKGLIGRKGNPLIVSLSYGMGGIFLGKCPLTNPPIEIAAQGNDAILRYWDQMEISRSLNLSPYINTDVKLILVGNPDSGKTTLAKYLSEGVLSDAHAATHGMEVIEWRPEFSLESLKGEEGKLDGECLVRIFDFGGQEYYHDTHQLFFTTNTAYILLWDEKGNRLKRIKRDQKQDGAAILDGYFEQHYPLEYWLDAVSHFVCQFDEDYSHFDYGWDDDLPEGWEKLIPVQSEAEIQRQIEFAESMEWNENAEVFEPDIEDHHLVLLQTKIDRDDIAPLDQRQMKAQYPFIYDFSAVSLGKTSPKRLAQTKLLVQELLEQVKIIGGELPPQYGWVKEALEHQKSKTYRWSMTKFRKWANLVIGKKHNVSQLQLDDDQTFDLVGYLYRIGLLLHFEDSDRLANQVFVKPNQVMGYIYEILKVAGKQSGRFTELDAMNALDRSTKQIETYKKKGNLDPDTKTILELMRHFKIAFLEGGQKGKYVAPLYLPIKPVQGVQFLLDIYQKPVFRIQYQGYIHKSVVLDFFERFGPNALKDDSREGSEMYYYWRNGIIVKDPSSNTRILVQFSMDNQANLKEPNRAHIDVFELTNEPHSAFLESIMDALSEINRGWKTTTMVTANGKDFVPLNIVENAAAQKQFTFFHQDKIFQLIDFRKFIKLKMPMKKVFISYSKADVEYLKQLENHLSVFKRNGNIATWNDRKLIPGEEWDGKIKKELEEADIILFLISADFLSTDYIWETEMKRALDRDAKGEAKIVPIVVRPCAWKDTPLGKFYSSAKSAPISMAANQDEAWRIVVEDLEKIMVSDTQGRDK